MEAAHLETALPKAPRLAEVELPRTTNQLRLAAAAARDGSWRRPVWGKKNNIHSVHGPLGGPVVIFGPNNFPFAYNGISGCDFAAAIAAGNPGGGLALKKVADEAGKPIYLENVLDQSGDPASRRAPGKC